MAALVLAAGFGSRLLPLTRELPKALMPVGDRSLLAHVVGRLRASGETAIACNAHHLAPLVVEEGRRLHIDVVVEGAILGTAGGIRHLHDVVRPAGEAVVVWNVDSWVDVDVNELRRARERESGGHGVARGRPERRPVATLVVRARAGRVDGVGPVGIDACGDVVRLRDFAAGAGEAADVDYLGVAVLSANFVARLPANGCLVADGLMPALARGERIATWTHRGCARDLGTAEELLSANLEWIDRYAEPNVTAYVAADAAVAEGIRLARCIVGGGATIELPTSVRASELAEVVVLAGARAVAPLRRAIVSRDSGVVQL